MLRTVLSVVVGYVIIAILIFVALAVAYAVMKTDGALRPGSFDVTTAWAIVSIILGFFAAIVGGLICVAIARKARGPVVLASVVWVLGLVFAIPAFMVSDGEEAALRDGDIGMMEAMQKAEQPSWVAIVNPFVGAIGVLVGSQLLRRRETGSMNA